MVVLHAGGGGAARAESPAVLSAGLTDSADQAASAGGASVCRNDQTGQRLDPDEAVAYSFDAGRIFGRDLKCGALALVGDAAAEFDDGVFHPHVDAEARAPGFYGDFRQDAV